RADLPAHGDLDAQGTRKAFAAASGALSERGLAITEVAEEVARELETTAARVALAWLLAHPAVTAPVLGARTLAQLDDDLGALELRRRARARRAGRPRNA